MEKITIDNYEAFVLDYFEGCLSADLCEELELFVLSHPELEINLKDNDLPIFEFDDEHAEFKSQLKKTEFNFQDESVLSYLENLLTEVEQKAFEIKLLSDKELQLDLQQFKKTILEVDQELKFDHKAQLFKNEDDFVLNNRAISYFENAVQIQENLEIESDLSKDLVFEKELELVSKTKLIYDSSVVFPNKEDLKKENKIYVWWDLRNVTTMAAAILFLVTMTLILKYYQPGKTAASVIAEKSVKKNETVLKRSNPIFENKTQLHFDKRSGRTFANIKTGKKEKKYTAVGMNESVGQIQSRMEKNEQNEVKTAVSESFAVQPLATEELNKEIKNKELDLSLVENPVTKDNIFSNTTSVLSRLEETVEDDDDNVKTEPSFWKKAVQLAKRINRMGIKSVNGVEKPNDAFALSVNSMSLERH
jgi:hypothetical protein